MPRQIDLPPRSEQTAESPRSADSDEAKQILQGLNEKQREAVKTTDGPVLIIAGPGSGKTRTLTHRIAYLLATGQATPHEVLALTFTNKAAREMKQRVQALVGGPDGRGTKGLWMGTFHSTFARLLRREADKLGYSQDFSIYDTGDAKRIIRDLAGRLGIDTQQFRPRALQRKISSAKNQMLAPAEYRDLARGRVQEMAAQVFGPYQEALRRANAMDFDDLLLRPIDLFDEHPDVLKQYQERWRYVHIDEYQDTNKAQYTLAQMLSARHKNLCVVGDDAQSIYAFRGADIQNILSFQRDYDEATAVRLEQNYRSTGHILQLADSVIDQNDSQLDKELWTSNDEGEPVVLMEALSEKDEAQKIERHIRDLHVRDGYAFSDFAILYRTNAQSRALEKELRQEDIPYRIIGGTSFYQRKEIKDVLAYLKLVVNPSDAASLRRVINYPKRGIGQKTQERVFDYANEHGLTLWQAVEDVQAISTLSTRAKNAVEKFGFLIKKHASKSEDAPAEELAKDLIKEAGVLEELRKEHTRENLVRWENVQELIGAIAEFTETSDEATLSRFLQEVLLLTDEDAREDDSDRVTLMTMHGSKGTEYPVVFVSGLEEGLFPLKRATEEPDELEEERRLFYVSVTRAEERLFLSHARSRYRYGERQSSTRSRFLEEVDPDVVRTEAGERHEQNEGRFSVDSSGGGGEGDSNYQGDDPHYYRRDLRSEDTSTRARSGAHDQRRRTVRREKSSDASESSSGGGRRVVYDEGEGGEIAPGAQVEHPKFGQGKVLSRNGQGEKATATIFFGQEVGQKKLRLKFAGLRLVG
ncbi:MAG: ATP-dependent DNA helicase PcrA [Bacteroidetes bacterium QS_8_68_15]|nr:MAG: ATP-dependent DNA helicase PcrA [Bacteroidetes bacterium QS_8_68_15]